MHTEISFPNLGIYLKMSERASIYSEQRQRITESLSERQFCLVWIAAREAKRTGQNPENYLDMGIIGVIAGIVGARLYYVIFSWDMYKDNLLDILI